MIRIIERLFIKSFDAGVKDFIPLDIVPGSATLTITDSRDEGGRVSEYKLNATLRKDPGCLGERLAVRVFFCGRSASVTFGTEDLPVFLSVTVDNRITISCKHKEPGRSRVVGTDCVC